MRLKSKAGSKQSRLVSFVAEAKQDQHKRQRQKQGGDVTGSESPEWEE
jgi:hypothetical protein